MDHQTDSGKSCLVHAHGLTLSGDGHVRLTMETLLTLHFEHLLSGLDGVSSLTHPEGACVASISGYTEWLTTTTPTVTMGWDWQLDVSQGQPIYTRQPFPRSNIMIIDRQQYDLGAAESLTLVERAIDALTWQETVRRHIAACYVYPPCQG